VKSIDGELCRPKWKEDSRKSATDPLGIKTTVVFLKLDFLKKTKIDCEVSVLLHMEICRQLASTDR